MTKIYEVVEYINAPSISVHLPYAFVFFAKNNAWRGGERLQEYKDCLTQIQNWCEDQFGNPTSESQTRWSPRDGIFLFANQADAAAFKIRWL